MHGPGKREPGLRVPAPPSDFLEPGESRFRLFMKVDILVRGNEIEPRAPFHSMPVFPGQKAGTERAVGDDGNIILSAELPVPGFHIANRVIEVVLEHGESGQSIAFLHIEEQCQLVLVAVADSQSRHETLSNHAIQRCKKIHAHRAFIPLMEIEKIDPRNAESFQALLDGRQHTLRGKRWLKLGRNRQLAEIGATTLEPGSDHDLGCPIRISGSRIEKGDSSFKGIIENLVGRRLVDLPPERDATQPDVTSRVAHDER